MGKEESKCYSFHDKTIFDKTFQYSQDNLNLKI